MGKLKRKPKSWRKTELKARQINSTFKILPQTIKFNHQHMLVDTTYFLCWKDFTCNSSYLHVTALEVSAL